MLNLPEIIILSTQRSGTHLLESFLTKHPRINGKGEMFLRYKRTGILKENDDNKINVAILMYSEINVFLNLGGGNYFPKIIHLIRAPYQVALSRLQMQADKLQLGDKYKAHCKVSDLQKPEIIEKLNRRNKPDLSTVESLSAAILKNQTKHISLLEKVHHLQIDYNEIAQNGKSAEYLNEDTQRKLLAFLELPDEGIRLYTTYFKTGIVK